MAKACENWLSLVNNCFYYARLTHEIYQVLPYWVDHKTPQISKLPGSFEIHWVRQYLVNVVLFGGTVNIWNDHNFP